MFKESKIACISEKSNRLKISSRICYTFSFVNSCWTKCLSIVLNVENSSRDTHNFYFRFESYFLSLKRTSKKKRRLKPSCNFDLLQLQVATLNALYFFIFLSEIDRFSTTVSSRKFSVSVWYPRSNAAASSVRREPKFPNFNDEQMRDSRDEDNTTLKWKSARVWEFYYT